MAGIYTPTISSFPNGIVTVQSADSTSYAQIINSMGSYVYNVAGFYLKAGSNAQILKPFFFSKYDVNGNIQAYSHINVIDPYQYQASINQDVSKEDIFLNGRTSLTMNILPLETLYLILYVNQLKLADYLKPDPLLDNDFFKDYAPSL